MYLAWFGVHYFKHTRPDGSTLWPTDPVKAVLQGKTTPAAADNTQAAVAAAFDAVPDASTPAGSGTASAAEWSHAQLETLWTDNGGAHTSANIAAAIAQAESGGNARATSDNPDGGTNVGLWQLDTPGGKGAGYTVAQLQDPGLNARVTVFGSANGTDWSAWATYASGEYLAFMR